MYVIVYQKQIICFRVVLRRHVVKLTQISSAYNIVDSLTMDNNVFIKDASNTDNAAHTVTKMRVLWFF
jgi:hypothetical protein